MSLQNDLNRAVSIHSAGRIISRKSFLDRNWQADLLRNWAGLSFYQQVTRPAIDKYTNLSKKNTSLAHDLGKTFSIIVITSILEGAKLLWNRLLLVLIGTVLYHYMIREHLVNALGSAIGQDSMDWMEDWTENIIIMTLSDFVQGNPVNWKTVVEQLAGLGAYYHLLRTKDSKIYG